MSRFSIFSIITVLLTAGTAIQARDFVGAANNPGNNGGTTPQGGHRSACIESRAQTDLNINNVRARLLAGGDMWWDGNATARYVVPNVDPASGKPEISSLFAGAVWLGAYDDGGNLILAAQTYRSSGNDFWNGPLDPLTGTIEKADCERWDRHFEVAGADIDLLRADFLEIDPATGETDFEIDNKPSKGILGWPGRGNPYFAEIYGFELPDQDLAPFVDFNEDGVYDPYDGDHPIIEVTGCNADYYNPVYADQMIWWVYNDNGNIHTQTNGQPMIMEVQVTAFGYRTTDAINNMTFYRYKLLNRNALTLKETYFSLWSDPDLGCFSDDMIGCDTITGMGYVYNGDNDDNATCGANGSVGYGTTIPALGVDYFRGPLDSAGNQIGLSSFQYHVNNNGVTGDPQSALGYYRLISGFWPDGTPITSGGTGYNAGGGTATDYVFYSWPNETAADSWSMCFNGQTGAADFRFLHTSGPFVLKPGATNEMISGVVWVPELPDYPCPSMKELVQADELAQNLFDDCFKITDGPDAPYIDIIELENQLILNLSYTPAQNNYELTYEESPAKLREFEDSVYRFQGYKVYQVVDANVSVTDLEDAEKARLIYQCDMQDSVAKIINWTVFPDESIQPPVFIPTVMVDGENKGLKHTFKIETDKFSSTGGKLVNHKPYYFCVVAYAFNEYQKYDPVTNSGQADSYLQGRRNFRIYTGIPRNNSPEYFGAVINAEYGDRPQITRIDGRGNGGGLFLDLVDRAAVEADMFADGKAGRITYVETGGPLDIKVVDPLRVSPGTFRLYISDEAFVWDKQTVGNELVYTPMPPLNTQGLGDSIYWALTNANDPSQFWSSFQTLDIKNEQYIPELGIALTIRQASAPGTDGTSGFIGSQVEYTDSLNNPKWYNFIADDVSGIFNVLKTGNAQDDQSFDPEQTYSTSAGGWYPFMLCDGVWRPQDIYFSPNEIKGAYSNNPTPSSSARANFPERILSKQRNVNVVITPDKTKWSRCIVVETASPFLTDVNEGLGIPAPSGLPTLQWKKSFPSVDKDGNQESGDFGKSWFPGYAYDVETGERLNIFFGENSFFNGQFFPESQVPGAATGNDMIYNPTDVANLTPDEFEQFISDDQYLLSSVFGGHHYIYVANSNYDECRTIRRLLDTLAVPPQAAGGKVWNLAAQNAISWASMSYLQEGMKMQGAKQNIPPSEVTFKLRVETPYQKFNATGENNRYPLYEFSFDQYVPTKENADAAQTALDLINVVPNPYYAYSDYEVTEVDNVIKIVNLPPRAVVKIFSIDGRFIKEYNIAQNYPNEISNGIARLGLLGSGDIENQVTTYVEWDLKNYARVPVGSGVYLIHVVANDINGNPIGERVLKSFIINRSFDPQKL